jgi:outer membrane protein OmpA-like peptidoglycan-associated protein
MHRLARLVTVLLGCAALGTAGCAQHHQPGATATAAAASPAATLFAPTPAVGSVASAAPSPSATPAPNLLSWMSGTVIRRYPAGLNLDVQDLPKYGFEPGAAAKGPWVFVFELPGPAKLTRVAVTVPPKGNNGENSTVTFAVSSSGPDSGFSDIATITSTTASNEQSTAVNASGRWIRATVTSVNEGRPFGAIEAFGQIASGPPASVDFAGTYVQYDNPYDKSGEFREGPDNRNPWYLRVVDAGRDGVSGEQCFDGPLGDSYPGTKSDRTWTWTSGTSKGTFIINDEGTMLVGNRGGMPAYWVRTNARPKYCYPQTNGKGPINVVVLEPRSAPGLYPTNTEDQAKDAPRYRFSHLGATLVDQHLLDSASILVLNGLCDADDLISSTQGQLILQWVAAGHKLLIYDADMCGQPTHYALLPYQFKSDNPGAKGAKGDRLILVEDNTLGTSDKSDKVHFLDASAYAKGYNQLGDANTVTTQDAHWCGHLFGTNANHVNGFMQMYANYGKGVIIYDGFDHDDAGAPSYRRARMLELDQPIPADLPCTQQASLSFLIEPNRTAQFVPGKAQTMTFPMELLANQGWKGHVILTASGDFKGSVTPGSFDVAGGTKPLKIAVKIPANAKPGTYNVVVTGDGGNKQTAQASIQLVAAVPIVKQFQQKRIRLYGIHFDVDKATIKPQSEPVIAQIGSVMKQNPGWRFRVEGHTDSDGGYAHNMTLSQARAQSVVNDLVNRYHIARSRLTAVGYGYSKPVAPNTTAAGKALNRRVELVRL